MASDFLDADALCAVLEWVREAGAMARGFRQSGAYSVVEKGGGAGPVTEADEAISAFLMQALQGAFPKDTVVSEESPAATQWQRRTWLIDPIDGTLDFVRGGEEFAVMVGLVVAGAPRFGVVYQPMLHRLYWGGAGLGAWCATPSGTVALRVSTCADLSAAVMVKSRHHPSSAVDDLGAELGIARVQEMGSMGLKVAAVAEGRADVYVNLSGKSSLWDVAGPQAILEAAGGRLSGLEAGTPAYVPAPLAIAHPVVASNGQVHDQVQRGVARVFGRSGGLR